MICMLYLSFAESILRTRWDKLEQDSSLARLGVGAARFEERISASGKRGDFGLDEGNQTAALGDRISKAGKSRKRTKLCHFAKGGGKMAKLHKVTNNKHCKTAFSLVSSMILVLSGGNSANSLAEFRFALNWPTFVHTTLFFFPRLVHAWLSLGGQTGMLDSRFCTFFSKGSNSSNSS